VLPAKVTLPSNPDVDLESSFWQIFRKKSLKELQLKGSLPTLSQLDLRLNLASEE
jgi:hypothetical protein